MKTYVNHVERREMGERLTPKPRTVLVKKRYKKYPMDSMATIEVTGSNLWIAIKSTTDVASFTTPSPKTRLYNRGVSS